MIRYIAFLRAINVGGHNVKMDSLCRIFEAIGFSKVETFIASGNVIFETASRNMPAMEKKIETELKENLGYEVATFIRTVAEILDIANYCPFPKMPDGARLYIGFLSALPPKSIQARLLSMQTKNDMLHFHGRDLYWLCQTRFSESPFSGSSLEKILGVPTTIRNATTVAKLAEKYGRR